VEEMEK